MAIVGTHTPSLQKAPAVQLASVVHVLGQAFEAPSHVYRPHEGVPVVPAETGPQVPFEPSRSHRSHGPRHSELQHTPSVHLSDWHWLAPVHAAPSASLATQAPLEQNIPTAHVASLVHEVGHAPEVPLHAYGAHEGLPGSPSGALVQVPTHP